MNQIWKWTGAAWLLGAGAGFAQADAGAAPAAEMLTLAELMRMGGWLMYVLAALSVLGLALIVYYALVLRTRAVAPAVQALRLLVATRGTGHIVSAGSWGKLKTVWQMVAIIATFILLAARTDVLPYLDVSAKFLRQYDSAFVITSWILSTLVVLVTLISGWTYFADHWDLVTAEM